MDDVLARGRAVIRTEAAGLVALEKVIDQAFGAACQLILGVKQRLAITGMGKSGHVARKIAATFAATGTPSIFIHPSEAAHGDLGMMVPGDVLLVLSNSGNTSELRAILSYGRRVGIPIIGVASQSESLVMEYADISILLPRIREACSANVAPTTSTTMQLALGDALAMAVMDMRGVSGRDLHQLHPAGSIGLALTPVSELAVRAEMLPLVTCATPMPEVISTITKGRFGVAGVIDSNGYLVGAITDGDLRRHFDSLAVSTAQEVMTAKPKVVAADLPAGEALQFLNANQITAAFVVEDPAAGPQPPLGIIHIHDLLRHGLG